MTSVPADHAVMQAADVLKAASQRLAEAQRIRNEASLALDAAEGSLLAARNRLSDAREALLKTAEGDGVR